MSATAPVVDETDRDEPAAFWEADLLPPSARVADRVLSTCRAAGCAPLTARRPPRYTPLRQARSPRRAGR
jgi:hypothetical protein